MDNPTYIAIAVIAAVSVLQAVTAAGL